MSGLHHWLFRIANDAAQAEQQRAERLVVEIAELEVRKAQAEAQLERARSAVDRLDRFDPVIGNEGQCALCWVSEGIRANSKLRNVLS